MENETDMKKIKEFFQTNDRLARHLGIEILEVGKGWAKTRMDIKPHHLNGVDMVHGGTIFTLADVAFAAAGNSHGTIAVAINVNISFIKAARGPTLYAEAKEVACHPKLSNCSIKVTDEDGDLIATFEGLAYRKKHKLIDHNK